MENFNSFSYNELLTECGKRGLPEALIIGENSPEALLILRLLSGSAKLTHNYTNKVVISRYNYFAGDFKHYGQSWKNKFPKLIADDMTSNDLGSYVNATKYINKRFYRNILSEISQFIYATDKKSHTTAFIFIYRLLEKIAFAFPLIYASRTQDFLSSFGQLKELMISDSEKKELGFFKRFVIELYKDDPISMTSVDINILTTDAVVQNQIFNEMKKVLDNKIIHADTNEPNRLSINFCDMGSFIITIRNRFFHNMNSNATNIQSGNIVDSDLFFSSINPLALQWLATVFLGVFTHSISEFQKIKQLAV